MRKVQLDYHVCTIIIVSGRKYVELRISVAQVTGMIVVTYVIVAIHCTCVYIRMDLFIRNACMDQLDQKILEMNSFCPYPCYAPRLSFII